MVVFLSPRFELLIHRFSIDQPLPSLQELLRLGIRAPLIVEEGGFRVGVGFPKIERFASLEAFQRFVAGSNDIVGFETRDQPGGSQSMFRSASAACEMLLPEAAAQLVDGGYINGWEYLAGDMRGLLLPLSAEMDEAISQNSFCARFPLLDAVMKWVFISNGPKAGSAMHIDPIGSATWMLQIAGSKIWEFENLPSATLNPGDLLIVPPGLPHRVTNMGSSFNAAVTHNWVDSREISGMWRELLRVADRFELPQSLASLSSVESDSLLFGLITSLVHSERGVAELVEEFGGGLRVEEKERIVRWFSALE